MTWPQLVIAAMLAFWTGTVLISAVVERDTDRHISLLAIAIVAVADVVIAYALHAGGFW